MTGSDPGAGGAPLRGPLRFRSWRFPRRPLAVLLACLSLAPTTNARERPPGFAVATAHPEATRAGVAILQAGGNAFDAAVAVSAALGVVEPYGSGLGGGGFWLLHRAMDGRQVMVDGRETAPRAARRDLYLDTQGEMVPRLSVDGPLAAAIPGVPAALDHIAGHYGRLPLAASLGPAVRLAREGFTVTPHYWRMAAFRRHVLAESPAAARTLLDDGAVPEEGSLVRQPELAATLETLAREGRQGFYAGPVAEALVRGVRGAGGIWTLADLAAYRVVERRPVVGRYRGLRVVSASPPSSGGTALVQMLNILAGYPLEGMTAERRTHLIVEAMRRAYRDRAEYLGDPDFHHVPVHRLTDRRYAASQRAGIQAREASPSSSLRPVAAPAGGYHTTHFSILDAEGNRVAATLSINYPFGSGFMPEGTGVLLNDEMDDFAAAPGIPNAYGLVGGQINAIAPGKRPLSSMSPTFVEGPAGVAVLGTPGGSRIISMVLLAVLDLAAGHGPESWVARPRFHHQYLPDEIVYEPGALGEDLVAALARMGHRLRPLERDYGNMQALFWDRRSGRISAASDPRGEGLAMHPGAPVRQ